MQVYELAKKTGKTNKEIKALAGVDHHMDSVPDELVAELLGNNEEVAQPSAEIVNTKVEEKPKEPEVDPKVVELANRCLGSKSPYWNKRG